MERVSDFYRIISIGSRGTYAAKGTEESNPEDEHERVPSDSNDSGNFHNRRNEVDDAGDGREGTAEDSVALQQTIVSHDSVLTVSCRAKGNIPAWSRRGYRLP